MQAKALIREMADAGIHASEPVASIKGSDDRGDTYVAKGVTAHCDRWNCSNYLAQPTTQKQTVLRGCR
mgnify:FL=1